MMKEKLKKYYWILIIIFVVGAAFYWYEYRPTQIRKECAKHLSGFSSVYKESNYEKCLREHGLSQ